MVKRFRVRPSDRHSDLDCNTEVYACQRFIELETLAPLCRLEPGQAAEHDEVWEFYTRVEPVSTALEAERMMRKLNLSGGLENLAK